MRRIFSTVFAPQEPAFTVGSLAISATLRPPDQGEAGDHPVSAEPLGVPVGEQRLLGERLGSTSRATRSRTGILPCSAVFSVMALRPAGQRGRQRHVRNRFPPWSQPSSVECTSSLALGPPTVSGSGYVPSSTGSGRSPE